MALATSAAALACSASPATARWVERRDLLGRDRRAGQRTGLLGDRAGGLLGRAPASGRPPGPARAVASACSWVARETFSAVVASCAVSRAASLEALACSVRASLVCLAIRRISTAPLASPWVALVCSAEARATTRASSLTRAAAWARA